MVAVLTLALTPSTVPVACFWCPGTRKQKPNKEIRPETRHKHNNHKYIRQLTFGLA